MSRGRIAEPHVTDGGEWRLMQQQLEIDADQSQHEQLQQTKQGLHATMG